MAALDDDDVVLLPVTSGRSTGRKNKKKSKASSTGPGKKSAKVMRDTQSSMTTQLPSPSAEPSSSSGTEMPYGGDIAAAMKANDRQAIRVIMTARSTPAATAEVVIASTSGGSSNTTCPICNAERDDVEMLEHASGIATVGNITDHRACSECRASMIVTNSTCPWCRSEMVWRNLYGFLDGFKRDIGGSRDNDHQGLANLLTHWQEFEMTRSKSDLGSFARELCTDSSLGSHVSQALEQRSPWLRDSAGLWMRLYAMYRDGEIASSLNAASSSVSSSSSSSLSSIGAADATRLTSTVEACFDIFETNHGGHEDFIAAWYQQACAALLSALFSGSSTATMAALTKRAGRLCVEVFNQHYRGKNGAKEEVRSRLNLDYVNSVQDMVWGEATNDEVYCTFFL